MIYLKLFFEFFKTGLFTIGGALAAIPFLQEMSLKTGWFTRSQLADMIAVSESTPGPIGINMATYVGFTTAGVAGGVVASLGLITPSLVIVIIVARLLNRFNENRLVDSAFSGLRPASVGLICAAGLSILRLSLLREDLYSQPGDLYKLFDFKAILLAVILFLIMRKFKAHPIFFLLGSAVVGIIFKF